MFKMFDWTNIKKLPLACNSGYLKDIADKERRKKESLIKAQSFVSDFVGEFEVLSQFFDMKPKIGKFGLCEKSNEGTVVTLPSNVIKGLTIKFYISYEGITGFEFTEIDNEDS
tara:strand:- start:437 stop:775 length:339 start_codon:yes stop_codon:yes gene_type:complete